MNFVQLTQYIKQRHDALQGYVAQAISVRWTVYSQFFGTLFQRLGAMTTQNTQLVKIHKQLNNNDLC
ncbi:hypothetical protein AGMMS50262_18130 [Bacteroidia bacterium]|nr:hypothetical protein AGMMS50262_18130 [Bacteroidia bacterium]